MPEPGGKDLFPVFPTPPIYKRLEEDGWVGKTKETAGGWKKPRRERKNEDDPVVELCCSQGLGPNSGAGI